MANLQPTFLIISLVLGVLTTLATTQIFTGSLVAKSVKSLLAGILGTIVTYVVLIVIWAIYTNLVAVIVVVVVGALLWVLFIETRT